MAIDWTQIYKKYKGLWVALKNDQKTVIAADETTLATSREGVFAGGDVVAGPSSVIDAIAHGKRAAKAIDNYLTGQPLDKGIQKPVERANPPRFPRDAMLRMNIPGSVAILCIRILSPKIAPPVKGLEGSTAMMPTFSFCLR